MRSASILKKIISLAPNMSGSRSFRQGVRRIRSQNEGRRRIHHVLILIPKKRPIGL